MLVQVPSRSGSPYSDPEHSARLCGDRFVRNLDSLPSTRLLGDHHADQIRRPLSTIPMGSTGAWRSSLLALTAAALPRPEPRAGRRDTGSRPTLQHLDSLGAPEPCIRTPLQDLRRHRLSGKAVPAEDHTPLGPPDAHPAVGRKVHGEGDALQGPSPASAPEDPAARRRGPPPRPCPPPDRWTPAARGR